MSAAPRSNPTPPAALPTSPASGPCDIAVVAAATLFPGSPRADAFWQHMVLGSDLMTEVPTTHWLPEDYYDADPKKPGKVYSKRGAFIPAIDFDPLAFGIPPTILSQTDSTQVLSLWVTRQLLETTESLQRGTVSRDRVGVILGGNTTDLTTLMAAKIQRPVWERAMRGAGVPEEQVVVACDQIFASYPDWTEATFPGLLANVIAGRVANRFDFGGTNFTIDAACASSLAAVAVGVQHLQLGLADLVVTGGAETLNTPHMYMCFSKTPALSPTGDCRPFSDRADGTMMGEGVGMLALRRLADAERDGDRIYGVIRGIGSGSDGRAKSVYAPRADGQARALARAYEQAGFGPDQVGLIEAHGTGTVAGDAAEVEGLKKLFSEARERRQGDNAWCALGSLKSQFGHLKTAAGVAGLFKIIMALHHRVLPGTIKIDRPGAALADPDLPFYLNARTRPWIVPTGESRKAGVSAFGFGGTNFHFVAEEYVPSTAARVGPRDRFRTATKELIPLSATNRDGLVAAIESLRTEPTDRAWTATAKSRQLAFQADAPVRLIVLAADRAEALRHAEAALTRWQQDPTLKSANRAGAWWFGYGEAAGPVAFLFPGQGSQYVGMGESLACEYDGARRGWDAAAALTARDASLPAVADLVFPRPVFSAEAREAQTQTLKRTENAQPALGAASLAVWNLLQVAGVHPAMVGGHSYGELMALRAAGVMPDDETLLRASAARGRIMAAEAANRPGAMVAVGAGAEGVRALLGDLPGVVLANLNSPRQTVLAGSVDAMAAAETVLRKAGLTVTALPVATAFHSEIVAGAQEPFAAALAQLTFKAPAVPVYRNTTAALYAKSPRLIRSQLAEQLAAPVQFEAQIRAMHAAGARVFVEVGPGQVLTRLVGDILADVPHCAIPTDDRKAGSLLGFSAGLGALAAAGVKVDFGALWTEFAEPPADPVPLSKATVKLNGTQFGKPYPTQLPNPKPVVAAPPFVPASAPRAPSLFTPSTPVPMQSNLHPPPSTLANGTHASPVPAAPAGGAGALVALQHNMLLAFQAHQHALNASYAAYAHASEVALRQLGGHPDAMAPVPTYAPQYAPPPPPIPMMAPPTYSGNGYPPPVAPVAFVPPPTPNGTNGVHGTNGHAAAAPVAAARPMTAPPATVARVAAPAPAPAPAPTPTPVPNPAPESKIDAAQLLFDVVAEATGYPAEMLQSEMQLEADLGIDSIKRVEIFSALSGKVPQLGSIEPAQVAKLGTLGEICDFIGQSLGAPASGSVPARNEASDADAVVESASPQWEGRPAPGFSVPGLRAAAPAILSLTSDTSIAEPLAVRLREAGLAPRVGGTPAVDTRLLISLHGLEDDAPGTSPVSRLLAAFAAVRAAADGLGQPGAVLVMVMDRLRDPWGGGVAGLARTARREWPDLQIKLIDVATQDRAPEAIAGDIARELLTGFDEIEVQLGAGGERRVPVWSLVENPAEPEGRDAAPATGVWLVSGGARGVTPACLAAVAQRGPVRLALLGRTALTEEPLWADGVADEAGLKKACLAASAGTALTPAALQVNVRQVLAGREAQAAMAELRQAGAEVRYFAVDVTDQAALTDVVAELRRTWGSITGVVHAAGVLADKRIADKTDEQFLRVVGPKVDGLRALLVATEHEPLRHLVAFTSVAGSFGNPGQADYAVANTVLDAVLQSEQVRRGARCRVRATAWGPWDGGMVTPALRQHFASQGIALIPREAGAECFARHVLGPASKYATVNYVVGAGIRSWLPQPPARGAELRADWWLNLALHPWIGDHRVHGTPVMPIVMVGEFCTRAASLLVPGLRLRRARDLRVLNGLRLPDDAPAWIEVVVSRGDGDTFHCQMVTAGVGGREHYRVTIELTAEASKERVAPDWTQASLPEWSGDAGSFYQGLFHGPRFQAVCALRGRSDDEVAVEIAEPGEPLDATPDAWLHACAWLDAAAQAALAHALQQHGSLVLPQRMAAQEFFAPFPREGRVLARLRRHHSDALQERWDIAYLNVSTGKLIAIMHDLMLLKVGVLADSEVSVHG